MIWIAVLKAMMGLGFALPVQKKASAGAAPIPPVLPEGSFYQIIFVV
jgi:hypothetical protein